ncbi:hypothetical protein BH24ACT9_BH24ACT9_18460 [soil metagenome]
MVHILIPRAADHRTTKFIVLHRYPGTELPSDLLAYSAGLAAVRPAPTVVDCWSILDRGHRRDLVITAVRDRRIAPEDIRRIAEQRPLLRGRGELIELAEQLRAGRTASWRFSDYEDFEHPSLPRQHRQFVVVVDGSRYVLDVAWPELRLAVELDGAAFHGGTAQRERDVRRDAAWASSPPEARRALPRFRHGIRGWDALYLGGTRRFVADDRAYLRAAARG